MNHEASSPEDKAKTLAHLFYTHYCREVGGKAYNGDLLPAWEEFVADPAKQTQAKAWLAVGTLVVDVEKARTAQIAELNDLVSSLLGFSKELMQLTGVLFEAATTGYNFEADELGLRMQVSRAKEKAPKAGPENAKTDDVPSRVREDKMLRAELDFVLQRLKRFMTDHTYDRMPNRHRMLTVEHIEDAIMRLGMDLKTFSECYPSMGTPNPYPHSYNPKSAVIEPTADNLKL